MIIEKNPTLLTHDAYDVTFERNAEGYFESWVIRRALYVTILQRQSIDQSPAAYLEGLRSYNDDPLAQLETKLDKKIPELEKEKMLLEPETAVQTRRATDEPTAENPNLASIVVPEHSLKDMHLMHQVLGVYALNTQQDAYAAQYGGVRLFPAMMPMMRHKEGVLAVEMSDCIEKTIPEIVNMSETISLATKHPVGFLRAIAHESAE